MMDWAAGKAIADRLVEILGPVCERIEVAGSIRRRVPRVKDVELVMIPKLEEGKGEGQLDLFKGQGTVILNRLDELLDDWLEIGVIERRLTDKGRASWGPSAKRAKYMGEPVDLFSVLPPAQWGLIYMIRTGSGVGPEGSPMNGFGPAMLSRWKKISDGGFSKDGCLHLPDGRRCPTPEEEDVFRLCKMEVPPPEARTMAAAVDRFCLPRVL